MEQYPNAVPVPCLSWVSQEIGVREHTGSETRRINDVASDFEASAPVFPGNGPNSQTLPARATNALLERCEPDLLGGLCA